MKRISLLAVPLLVFTLASTTFAAGYGSAGCGWGGKVIDNNDILSQLGANFLNGFSSNQTFGMSSGTSGCSPVGLVLAENEQEVFVEKNYNALTKEMAVGEGENITVLASLLGCKAEETTKLGSFTQQNFPSIFRTDDTSPTEMLIALKEGLAGDPAFASSCGKI